MVYAHITTPLWNSKRCSILYAPHDHDVNYETMMSITDGDHEIASDAASWCELATVGEHYEFREGEITIVDM